MNYRLISPEMIDESRNKFLFDYPGRVAGIGNRIKMSHVFRPVVRNFSMSGDERGLVSSRAPAYSN
jgi:hypothetical protein